MSKKLLVNSKNWSFAEQISRLHNFFPGIHSYNQELVRPGVLAFPNWKKVAPSYGEAMEVIHDKLLSGYKKGFTSYVSQYQKIECSPNIHQAFVDVRHEQENFDIIIVPPELLLRDTISRLGAFEVGTMFLPAPLIACSSGIIIDCLADSIRRNGEFISPFYKIDVGKLIFDAPTVGGTIERCEFEPAEEKIS
ncbi:MAG: hypothetical protein WCK37_05030 [Candidatus Falkowbacteria bacterium]